MNWPLELRRHELSVGPEDEVSDEANGDPTSIVGEEDETGFDEMADWPEEDDGEDEEED